MSSLPYLYYYALEFVFLKECGLTGRKYTYEELRRKSTNLNKALRKKLNLQKRDVVAILLPNIPEYPICLLGSIEAGLTVTTINPAYTSGKSIKSKWYDIKKYYLKNNDK